MPGAVDDGVRLYKKSAGSRVAEITPTLNYPLNQWTRKVYHTAFHKVNHDPSSDNATERRRGAEYGILRSGWWMVLSASL